MTLPAVIKAAPDFMRVHGFIFFLLLVSMAKGSPSPPPPPPFGFALVAGLTNLCAGQGRAGQGIYAFPGVSFDY